MVRALVLNATYEPLAVVTQRRAAVLVLGDRADQVHSSGRTIRSERHELELPGSREDIYAGLTGDISGWWDHTFSGKPSAFFIEARPGGGFYEYFDDARENGVLHGTVIYAERGRKLTFRGPLGLSGNALDLVVTYTLTDVEGAATPTTRLSLLVSGAGRVDEGWDTAIDSVWSHFLFDRFKPWVEAGCHRPEGCRTPPEW